MKRWAISRSTIKSSLMLFVQRTSFFVKGKESRIQVFIHLIRKVLELTAVRDKIEDSRALKMHIILWIQDWAKISKPVEATLETIEEQCSMSQWKIRENFHKVWDIDPNLKKDRWLKESLIS